MGWGYLGIIFAVCAVLCSVGFYKFVYFYFVSAMFVPFSMLMLPLVKQVSFFNLDNKIVMIILYMVFGISMNTLLYVGYLKNIPLELEEAAYVDGAKQWTVFWKIIFPLLKPMHATVGIMTTLWAWNDVMMPLVILSDQSAATLPFILALWTILVGALQIIIAIQLKKEKFPTWSLRMGTGVFGSILGLLMLIYPIFGALVITILIGISLILFGILEVIEYKNSYN